MESYFGRELLRKTGDGNRIVRCATPTAATTVLLVPDHHVPERNPKSLAIPVFLKLPVLLARVDRKDSLCSSSYCADSNSLYYNRVLVDGIRPPRIHRIAIQPRSAFRAVPPAGPFFPIQRGRAPFGREPVLLGHCSCRFFFNARSKRAYDVADRTSTSAESH